MTTTELHAGFAALRALAEAVRELGSVPSGHLYAHVMGYMTLEAYEKAIACLERSTVIRRAGDVLHWNVAE